MAQYRDTIVGKFNGVDIDTLISEPIDSIKERAFWDWRIYSKNNTVDTLILSQRFSVTMIQEGDLDRNGTEEFGVRREIEAGTWDNYYYKEDSYSYEQSGKYSYFADKDSVVFYNYYPQAYTVESKNLRWSIRRLTTDSLVVYVHKTTVILDGDTLNTAGNEIEIFTKK